MDVAVPARDLAWDLNLCGFEVASIAPPPHAAGDGDAVLDFEITANRPDCLSVIGMAREAAARYRLPLKPIEPPPLRGREDELDGLLVTIEDAQACPRYTAALADVAIGPSPTWLARRLEAAGVRPINNVVDVTNYVLLETGHPLHAFDLARLGGAELRIRRASPGERITTLDGQNRALAPEMAKEPNPTLVRERGVPSSESGVAMLGTLLESTSTGELATRRRAVPPEMVTLPSWKVRPLISRVPSTATV